MKLQEKEAQKDKSIQEISLERTYSWCVFVILDLSHLDHNSKENIL